MRRLVLKGLHALLTDPVTGHPLDVIERLSLAMGVVAAISVGIAMLGLSLGLGGGQ